MKYDSLHLFWEQDWIPHLIRGVKIGYLIFSRWLNWVFLSSSYFHTHGLFLISPWPQMFRKDHTGITRFKPCFLLPPGKFNCKQVLLLTWALEPPYCHISLRPSVKHRARWRASYKKSESLLLIKELQDFDWFWKVAWSYIFTARHNLKFF